MTSSGTKHQSLWRPLLLAVIVVSGFILAKRVGAGDLIIRFQDYVTNLGEAGIFVFFAAYVLGVVAVFPSTALTLIAGPLFGPTLGIVVVSVASTFGACLAFLVARYFARDAVSELLNKSDRFRKLDALTETHGSIMVAITRLVPFLPFTMLNYAFGLTRVPFWTYLFWSWVCMLPSTAFYVLGTDVISHALTDGKFSWAIVLSFLVLLAVLGLFYRMAHKKIGNQLDSD